MTKNLDKIIIETAPYVRKAKGIGESSDKSAHFNEIYKKILGNIGTYIFNGENLDNSEALKEVERDKDILKTYLELIEKYPNFKEGELTKEGYFPKFKGAAEDYIAYAQKVFEA